MLQTTKPVIAHDSGHARIDALSPAELLRLVVGFLRRQYAVILFLTFVAIAAGSVYLFTTPPSFTALTKLIIDTRKMNLFQQQAVVGDAPLDSASVDSQIELLRSENVILSVIKDLRLTEDPEFVRPRRGLVGATLGFIPSLLSSGGGGQPSEFQLTRTAMGVFSGGLEVRRVGLSYVIDISFRSYNPERAAQVANAVADAYIVDQLEAKYQATRRASIWLQDRIKELREQAMTAERAVVEFKNKNNILETGGRRLMSEQQLGELNTQAIAARAQTAEAKARVERIDDILQMDIPDATVTDTLRNEVINRLRTQYLDYSRREADFSMRYGRNHLAAVNLRAQMREIRRSITDELQRIAASYKSDYEIAKAREEAVERRLDEIVSQSQLTNQAQITLRELESTAQTYRSLHDNFLQRYMESVQQQSFPITEARVITPASRPLGSSHPKSMKVMAAALAGGLFVGFGLAFLRDLSDRRFRTAGQIEGLLHTPCLAIIPYTASDAPKKKARRHGPEAGSNAVATGSRLIERDQSVLWTVVDSPFSRFAEAIRSIKVAIDVSSAAAPKKVIGITSAVPNEGKSTVAMSLALLMAQGGARVLLVDGDLRNPSLSRKVAPHADRGLLEVIAGTASVADAVHTDPASGLSFLPAFLKSRVAHSVEIVGSPATAQLLDSLRQSYDLVIVDLPPLAPVVDVRAAARLMDAFAFVVEWGKSKIDVVEHALNASPEVAENMLGAVLNKADVGALSRYENYRGSYYYNRYYSRYGYTD
jgi:succinoglycan biosynthesis transport protein ExoP